MKRGLFITAEGTDGSGKSTQLLLMVDYLKKLGLKVVTTREPGGTFVGEKIRDILLDPANLSMCSTTEMLLYAAARAQNIREVIRPAVEAGSIVVCDRFIDSSLVYQGVARGLGIDEVLSVNAPALDGMMPDITFFFDLSPDVALKRRIEATSADRIELEGMDFQVQVYEGYKKVAERFDKRITVIDSGMDIDSVFAQVKQELDKYFIREE